jgi:hypothetical protein
MQDWDTWTQQSGIVANQSRFENDNGWAPGFFNSIANVAGRWVAVTIMGEVTLNIAPHNTHGVLDHGVTLSNDVLSDLQKLKAMLECQ